MAKDMTQIRQRIAEDHPQLAEVMGREGLSELVRLIEEVVAAKLDRFKQDAERQKHN
jgi:hypothetical protein